MGKYNVTIGDEFEIASAKMPSEKVIEAATEAAIKIRDTKTRSILAIFVAIGAIAALVVAAGVDLNIHPGIWTATEGVWAAIGFPLGALLVYYFTRDRTK